MLFIFVDFYNFLVLHSLPFVFYYHVYFLVCFMQVLCIN